MAMPSGNGYQIGRKVERNGTVYSVHIALSANGYKIDPDVRRPRLRQMAGFG